MLKDGETLNYRGPVSARQEQRNSNDYSNELPPSTRNKNGAKNTTSQKYQVGKMGDMELSQSTTYQVQNMSEIDIGSKDAIQLRQEPTAHVPASINLNIKQRETSHQDRSSTREDYKMSGSTKNQVTANFNDNNEDEIVASSTFGRKK